MEVIIQNKRACFFFHYRVVTSLSVKVSRFYQITAIRGTTEGEGKNLINVNVLPKIIRIAVNSVNAN